MKNALMSACMTSMFSAVVMGAAYLGYDRGKRDAWHESLVFSQTDGCCGHVFIGDASEGESK